MKAGTEIVSPFSIHAEVVPGTGEVGNGSLSLKTFILGFGATLATVVSLAIAAFAGWQRGGIPIERAMNVSLCCVAVLYVHCLPVVWRSLGVVARICAFAVWWVACAVVLFGQVSFFMLSQQHAGDERAASIAIPRESPGAVLHAGRSRTLIALDIAAAKATLAQLNARRCVGDCPTLAARRLILAARLTALSTEDSEAMRQETDLDRERKRADWADALRERSRNDPVALAVVARLHTTEDLFALIVAVACAVVLEGTAILGWLLVSVAGARDVVAHGRGAVVTVGEAVVAPHPWIGNGDGAVGACVAAATAAAMEDACVTDDGGAVTAEDEHRLETIRTAVLAGTLHPTQEAIRRLLRCRQPTAGRLNRLYGERYGNTAQDIPMPSPCAGQSPATLA
ncbi:hypothetical protein [Burkholderia glumae]|uniref:hypothetical protein n=1 Tax=Burkholderia glumae TaxID=337 RepID=UPI00148E9A11|nr:hypothetical protein [Burkholderia glumae]QJW78730.1 hypothetical protein GAS18_08160 [Burkholderia glumae]